MRAPRFALFAHKIHICALQLTSCCLPQFCFMCVTTQLRSEGSFQYCCEDHKVKESVIVHSTKWDRTFYYMISTFRRGKKYIWFIICLPVSNKKQRGLYSNIAEYKWLLQLSSSYRSEIYYYNTINTGKWNKGKGSRQDFLWHSNTRTNTKQHTRHRKYSPFIYVPQLTFDLLQMYIEM